MDHEAWDDEMAPEEDVLTPEPVERTGPAPRSGPRHAGRLGISVPGAVGAALLVGAIAFGANLGLVGSQDRDRDATASASPAEIVAKDADATSKPTKAPEAKATTAPDLDPTVAEPTAKPEPRTTEKPAATEKPEPKPTAKPEPKPTAKPTPKPTPKPTAKPVLEIAVVVKEGAVVVKWSACEVDGADVYKIVRSSDSTVRWPAGDNDTLIGAVEIGGTRKAWDGDAPAGKKVWYRVFCAKRTESGYKVLAASGAASIVAPEPAPKPTPKPTPEVSAMWIEAGQDGASVVLGWEACGSDGFSHYRIVRKVDGEGGVIAEIEDAGTTTFVDAAVEPGVTYHYVVQAKGQLDGEWLLLGTTEWVSVSVE
jgi:hypothetical protein